MDPAFESLYHRLEQRHWWFRGRRELVRALVRQLSSDRSADLLDVGCASGILLDELTADGFAHPAGLDISESAIRLCHDRGHVTAVRGDATAPPLPPASVDIMVASDVLEHLEQDQLALDHWLQIVRPGGHLIVFVPAFQWLWSQHDQINHHFRRYTRSQLVTTLSRSGWVIQRSGYWNTVLFPAVAAVRLAAALFGRLYRGNPVNTPTSESKQLRETPAWINALCLTLLRLENRWLAAGLPLPIGVSTFAIATRPLTSSAAVPVPDVSFAATTAM